MTTNIEKQAWRHMPTDRSLSGDGGGARRLRCWSDAVTVSW